MAHATARTSSQEDHFASVLAEFSKTFSSPSSKHPNVRCISKASLVRELVALGNRLSHISANATSGHALLQSLIKSGLVHQIPLTDSDGNHPTPKFFSIGLDRSIGELDPIELLQAIDPKGVVCYFTAVQFHDLTTQMPTHHHVARLSTTSPTRSSIPTVSPTRQTNRNSQTRNRFGRLQFLYQNIPYYITTREQRRIPGIQKRYYTRKTVFSVTTYEQTLLDTLHHPFSCGGSSVVFEAWNNATNKLDQSRLLEYLKSINDHRLTRRVGYILVNRLHHKLEAELDRYLHRIQRQVTKDETVTIVSLLPGYEYTHTNLDWRLEVP